MKPLRVEFDANAAPLTPERVLTMIDQARAASRQKPRRRERAEKRDDLGDTLEIQIQEFLPRLFPVARCPGGRGVDPLEELEPEGVIQRFEYTFDLAWHTVKDRLEYDGITLATGTPRNVTGEAFQAPLIEDGETWTDMLTDRNLMSPTPDCAKFEAVIRTIHDRYLSILDPLCERLSLEMLGIVTAPGLSPETSKKAEAGLRRLFRVDTGQDLRVARYRQSKCRFIRLW